MKVSIVMPVYNGSKYLRKAIDSILSQTYTNFELVVVDGGSTDGTLDILASYPEIRYISEKDEGQADALNKGFKMVSGDIHAWHNADDLYLPNTFQKIVDAFNDLPEVGLIYGNYQMIDAEDKWICDTRAQAWDAWLFQHGRFCPVQPTVFWRKSVTETAMPLNKALNFCMDVDFYARASKKFQFKCLDKILGVFRVHNESKTQNASNHKVHVAEYKKVLSENFNFSSKDRLIFDLFIFRSSITGYLNRNVLSNFTKISDKKELLGSTNF